MDKSTFSRDENEPFRVHWPFYSDVLNELRKQDKIQDGYQDISNHMDQEGVD